MKLKLFNYDDIPKIFDIHDLDYIDSIMISVITGDEVATVRYTNGEKAVFDSEPNTRRLNCYDGSYEIYNIKSKYNLFFDGKWLNRIDSYDSISIAWGESEK